MLRNDMPLDEAELLSVLMEGMLYGFSLLMFAGTIWVLLPRRSAGSTNLTVLRLVVVCLFLVLSTTHYAINITRLMEGFILYQDTHPGGPVAFFSNVSQWTFVYTNYVFTAQTLLGDSVALYRCYAVWQSKGIMVLPVLLWCAVGVTGIVCSLTASQLRQDGVFGGRFSHWAMSFWMIALVTDLLVTVLLAGRIWYVDRKVTRFRSPRRSPLQLVLHIVIDAGVIYSVMLLMQMICYLFQSNFQLVLLSMTTPIISITFYMVIIRASLAGRTKHTTNIPLTATDISLNADRRNRMQVHIAALSESKVDNGLTAMLTPPDSDSSHKIDDAGMPV